jgi:hypothetical protein
MLRVLVAVCAFMVALLIVGVGAGVAGADPDGTGDGTGTGTGTGTAEPSDPPPVTEPVVVEPEPTTATPPSIFDIPRNIANQLRDMMGRPLSIFGNGRTPGTHTVPESTVSGGGTTSRKRDKPTVEKPPPPAPEPVVSANQTSQRKQGSSSSDATEPAAEPAPPAPEPGPGTGYDGMRWRLNLSDPFALFTSVGQTLNTVNSLLADAYAPYNPFKPPPPKPEPTFRIMEEGPVDAGGTVDATPLANGSNLTVLQAPVIVPPVRMVPSRPITGSEPPVGPAPAGGSAPANATPPQVLAAGPAVEVVPAARGPVTQPGATPVEQLPPNASTSPMALGGNPGTGSASLREGYPQYLRSARITQVATVALPGLAGLIALTAGGSVIGYRQANSGRHLRFEAERFLQ